jgi:hypothetical protein
MLLEDILLAVAMGAVFLSVALPLVRLLKSTQLRARDPLAEAQERLRIAKLEAEAAKLNKQTEEIYKHMYEDSLEDSRHVGTRVAEGEQSPADGSQEPTGKERTHGQK